LRVKDVYFTGSKLIIRQTKGNKDRVTLLPQRLKPVLAAHMEKVKALHAEDLARGLGEAPLPQALAGKYPGAGYSWAWQFVFPSSQCCRDPYTGRTVRFHLHEKTLQRTVKEATRRVAIAKPVVCHTFRRVRNPLAGIRAQHSRGTGVDGPQGRRDDPDLYARDEQQPGSGQESGRRTSRVNPAIPLLLHGPASVCDATKFSVVRSGSGLWPG
jgi:integrase